MPEMSAYGWGAGSAVGRDACAGAGGGGRLRGTRPVVGGWEGEGANGRLDRVLGEAVEGREAGGPQEVAGQPQVGVAARPRPVSKFRVDALAVDHQGREQAEKSVVVVEHGRYLGFGFAQPEAFEARTMADFKLLITPRVDNKDTDQIIRQYLRTGHPDQVMVMG